MSERRFTTEEQYSALRTAIELSHTLTAMSGLHGPLSAAYEGWRHLKEVEAELVEARIAADHDAQNCGWFKRMKALEAENTRLIYALKLANPQPWVSCGDPEDTYLCEMCDQTRQRGHATDCPWVIIEAALAAPKEKA